MTRRILTITALCALAGAVLLAQLAPQGGQPPSTKGVVIKGNAPVSNEILKVKLPRPQEADLPNGIHLMILEDHRSPQVTMQLLIPGAGGYYDPKEFQGLAGFTAAMMLEGTATRTAQQIAQERRRGVVGQRERGRIRRDGDAVRQQPHRELRQVLAWRTSSVQSVVPGPGTLALKTGRGRCGQFRMQPGFLAAGGTRR
jgi:hypothetical protein